MRFEAQLAFRHLRSGGWQTVLTISAVATAVTVIIFITSLIRGLQQRIILDLIGSIAHVTVKPLDQQPDTLAEAWERQGLSPTDGRLLGTYREKQAQQRKELEDPVLLENQLTRFPGVRVVAAAVRGQAFLIRGTKRFGVTVSGADPDQQEQISHLTQDLIAGSWLTIGPNDVVIGYKLADEAGVGLGDRVRIQSSEGVSSFFTVAGLFDTGMEPTDMGSAFVTLRAAQGLFAMRRNASVVSIKLDDAFQANAVSDQISAVLPLKTESWMREQALFMDALNAQNLTSTMISAFALLASTFGIASVLIVMVIQKQKQIGILKSMGAKDRQILLVFTLEGLGVAVVGALAGAALGFILLSGLAGVKRQQRFGQVDQLFPIIFDARIFAIAMLAAIIATVLAALLPARRASRLNPVDVIRAG